MATANYSWSNLPAPQQGVVPWPDQRLPQPPALVPQRPAAVPPPLPPQYQHAASQRAVAVPNRQPTQQFISSPATVVDPWAQRLSELHASTASAQPWPNQQPSAQPAFSWPEPQPVAQPSRSWPNQQPGNWQFSTPVTRVEPVVQLAHQPRTKWRGLVAWTLWVLAGGLFAGPLLAEYADQGVAAGIAWVATWAPGFLRPYLPLPLDERTSTPEVSGRESPPAPAPSGAPSVQPTAAMPERPAATVPPSSPAVEPLPQPKPASDGAPARAAKAVNASATKPVTAERSPKATAQPRATHATHGKVASSTVALSSHPSAVKAKPASHPRAERNDPFDNDEPVATKRPAKPAPEPAPTPRSTARSSDGLDDLMNGMAGGTASKGKHSTSREIDAMLKDVQKSEPPPPPKRAEPAPLPPLSAADIAKAMAGVKSSANACGRRFGQSGAADLKLTVGKEGRVTDVAVHGNLADGPIAQCIAKAARGATFPRNAGLKFDYRIAIQ